MVLEPEARNASIHITDEMPDGKGEEYLFTLPISSNVEDLFTKVSSLSNYAPQSYDLLLQKIDGDTEITRDSEKNLKEAGLYIGSENHNIVKIVPSKSQAPPSIVISLANKAEESYDNPTDPPRVRRGVRRYRDWRDWREVREFNSRQHQCSSDRGICKVPERRSVTGYVGLVNQAMTCYLNSLLQALYMTPEFRNALYKWKFVGSAEEAEKSIPYQLQRLFVSLQTSKRSAVETSKLTKSFGWDASDSWQQHDIQELCRVMFDALERKFKDTDQADFINNLYQGKLIDYVTCLECGTEKTRIDTFLDIPLPVRPFGSTVAFNSVAEAMLGFIQPETLDGNNQYFCETCNKKCDAHKGLKFSHFPYILTLHLKRFDFDYNLMSRIKLTDRVEFPHVLNINNFLCDESKALIKEDIKHAVTQDTTPLDESCSPIHDHQDAMSVTDSASTLEDEGCQATEPSDTLENMHGSTSGSNSSGSNVDIQDYDEGIDISHGTSSQQENEKNRRHTEADGPPGPYVYELFSIMIHSGSASGGHYYVYIKDFDKGEWFCFDDQSVSRITNDDISMTFGGGAHRGYGGYYSGAHSSSTNAYMLMYRQIDKKRNQSVMSIDDFPLHLQELVKTMEDEEEKRRILLEQDKDRLKIKVYCRVPKDDRRSEARLVIDLDTTLSEATAVAHKLFFLDGIVPLDQCRLVSYDSSSNTIDSSFDDQDTETMGYICANIQNANAQSLYLEIREEDAHFETYRPGGVVIKVYRVHMDRKEVDPPVDVRTHLTTSFREIRPQIAKAVKLSPNIKVMMEKYDSPPIELDDDKTLESAGFYSINKIFVAELPEAEHVVDFIDKMSTIIERFSNTITLYCTLPDTDKETLAKLGISPISATEGSKVPNGEYDAAGDSIIIPVAGAKGTSRGGSPQLPSLDGEEEYIGATGCSDQSTSEDSSLTDSDRTIVGDDGDLCLAELSSASNSPPGSDQPNISSPEASPIMRMKQKEILLSTEKNGECLTDEKLLNSGYYYLKIHETQDVNKLVRVQIDKRMIMGTLKSALAQYMGISADYIKLFRKCGNNELPYLRSQDPLSSLRDEERIIVRLERALQKGEYRGKVFLLLRDDEPIKFLCDWILTKEMLVGEAKKQILNELKRKEDVDVLFIPYERCRLRSKKWKNPGKIFLDSQLFQDLGLTQNWEIFLQEIPGPELVTHPSQVTVMLRKFCTFNRSLGDFHEITLQSSSFTELRERVSEESEIPLESLEFARPSGTFPYLALNNNQAQTGLQWESVCNCNLEDGTVLYYRNKDDDGSTKSSDESIKMSCVSRYHSDVKASTNSENANAFCNDSRNLLKRSSKFVADKKKEKALRIVVSPGPKSTEENQG